MFAAAETPGGAAIADRNAGTLGDTTQPKPIKRADAGISTIRLAGLSVKPLETDSQNRDGFPL